MRRPFRLKHCKRVGAPLWRSLTPGQALTLVGVQKRLQRSKQSSFGARVRLRRFVCLVYGNLSATYFRRTAYRATTTALPFAQALVGAFERRLDVCVFRAGFASSIHQARQLIRHGRCTHNARMCLRPSMMLTDGDLIHVQGQLCTPIRPHATHLEVNYRVGSFVFLFDPQYVYFPSFVSPHTFAQLAP